MRGPSRRAVLRSCCALSLPLGGCIAPSDDGGASSDEPSGNDTANGGTDRPDEDGDHQSSTGDDGADEETSNEGDRDPLADVEGIEWRNGDSATLAALGDEAIYVFGLGEPEEDVAALDSATGDVQWSYGRPGRAARVGPTVADGIYYAVGSDHYGSEVGSLHALEYDGTERWSLDAGSYTAPFVADGRVFVIFGDQWVRAFDSDDSSRLWQNQFEDRAGGGGDWPTVVGLTDGTLIVRFHDGTLGGLDPETGAERWHFSAGEERLDRIDSVRISDGVYFSTTRETGHLRAGGEQWRVAHDRIEILGPVGDRLVLPTETGISARRKTDGQEVWSFAADDPAVAVQNDSIYACDEEITALGSDGSERWSKSLDGHPGYGMELGDEDVYVLSEDRLYRITPAGELRSTPFGPRIHTLLAGERAYVQTEDELVALDL